MSEQGNSIPPLKIKRVGIVVGEASGDILGAGLVAELKRRFPQCEFEGIGGPRMEALEFRSLFNMERLAVMGLVEPLKRLPELLSIRKQLRKHFIANPPDIFIGIDAPDFNLSLEQSIRAAGVPTAHYVSPSVWAWRQGRVKKIERAVDLMLTLFPFEENFYRDHEVRVTCVGHTLADDIALEPNQQDARNQLGLSISPQQKVVALLPGSRGAEVKHLGRVFFEAATLCTEVLPNIQFVVAAANEKRLEQIQLLTQDFPELPLKVVLQNSHAVMAAADVVLMASGTTTLEALLLKKPMVIAYKMAWLSWQILRRLVRSPFVGLPNLLAGKQLVPELLQDEATPENIAKALGQMLQDVGYVNQLQASYRDIHLSLRRNADAAAADAICELLVQRRDIHGKA
ncbi:lipid-A-disaccharide synthase [Teredinibacter franksiae]|uniref:lipid-A-disaccharide synthase n=1 Tax=Teredinibacter franksiae TaxID=2761453 RepID=UPI001624EBBF|nr:lipid-A-disaccharide synthase [Teredinibacter franksiae]